MFDSERVIVVPVFGKYYSAKDVYQPTPASQLKPHEIQKILEMTFPLSPASNATETAIISAFCATYPTVSVSTPGFVLGAPLKSNASPYSEIKADYAWRSGSRSAVISCKEKDSSDKASWTICTLPENGKELTPAKDGQNFIRIKGCGNWLTGRQLAFPGIIFKDEESTAKFKTRQIRAYPNTAFTEIYATSQINTTLSKLDLHPANIPIGVWVYGPLENDPAPLIEKAVIIMETFGDKRFETHLLSSLEILADQLISDSSASLVIQAVRKAFGSKTIPSISNMGADRAYQLPKSKVVPYAAAHIGSLAGDKIQGISHDVLIELGFTPTQTILQEINNISPKEPTIDVHGTETQISALVKLFARLGFECGRALRSVHSTAPGILWGTYQDFVNCQCHCNAHANNLIVLPLDIIYENKQILSPLDFDMAFSSETSINFWETPPVADPTFVTDNFRVEVFEMMNDLSGIHVSGDWMKIKDVQQRPLPENEDKQNIIWLLRDVMIWEYFIGYSNPTGGPTEDAIPAPTLPSDAEWPMIIEMIKHALSLSDHLHS